MEYSEDGLVSEIKKRNMDAFEFLMREYSRTVYYLAHAILKPRATKEDVEECVSDVFCDALVKIDEYDETKGGFRNWLLILTKYKALTYRRRLNKAADINIDDVRVESPLSVERQIVGREECEKVLEMINTFNEIDRELFTRRYLYDEKINDLMRGFDLSRAAVDGRLKRCRKIIREAIFNE